ncbi:DUF6471 domain-containing protein [Niveispirillum sp. KHB5.9]|uniref:DUF6471 domain-containing protein n=1 Tax=Niveispirillum sp. KHB5.9 TaxID=3400269 RepID=UPI003A877F05
MATDAQWAEIAKGIVKAELKRRNVTYEELAQRLTDQGIPETKASIASKLSRGGFTAAFMLAAMKNIGCDTIRVDMI